MDKSNMFYYSFLGLCQVQRLDILGFFFPPVLHVHLLVPVLYLVCCFSVSFLQLLQAFFQCKIGRKKNCLLCPPFLFVLVHLFGEPHWWEQKLLNLKSQNHKTSFCVQHYFVVFFLSFSWVSCCFFNWWANAHNQTSLPTFIFMCRSLGWGMILFHLPHYLKELNDSIYIYCE